MRNRRANLQHLENAGRALRASLRDYPKKAARPRELKRVLEAALDMVARAEKEMAMLIPEPPPRETPAQRRRRIARDEG